MLPAFNDFATTVTTQIINAIFFVITKKILWVYMSVGTLESFKDTMQNWSHIMTVLIFTRMKLQAHTGNQHGMIHRKVICIRKLTKCCKNMDKLAVPLQNNILIICFCMHDAIRSHHMMRLAATIKYHTNDTASLCNIFTAWCTIVQSTVLLSHVVCPSVCLSVMLVDHDHIGWKSWKLIAWTISPTSSLFVAQRSSTYSQGNMEKFWGD